MLSVLPGRLMVGTAELTVPPVVCAMLSVVLSTTTTELPEALKIIVNLRFGERAMSPGCVLLPCTLTTDGESTSCEASTMFRTGAVPPLTGSRGFETKARNLRPLTLWVLLGAPELPQEIVVTLPAKSTTMLIRVLFKPGTPKSMRDRDLDARNRIITERLGRISALRRGGQPPRCKSPGPLV